jgi:hypothetical protein
MIRVSPEPGRASVSTGVVFAAVLDHLNAEATRRCMQELAQEIDAHCRRLAAIAGAGATSDLAGAGSTARGPGAGAVGDRGARVGIFARARAGWEWSVPWLWLLALALGWLAGHHTRHCCAAGCGEGAAVQRGAGPAAGSPALAALGMCLPPAGEATRAPVCLWRRPGCIPASAPARPKPSAPRPQGVKAQPARTQAPRPSPPPLQVTPRQMTPAAPRQGTPAAPRQMTPAAPGPVPVRPAPRPRQRQRPPLIYCDPAMIEESGPE